MDAVEIPPKKQFKIGEVARLFELEPYVLRYWETEFDQLKPRKTASGQRSYNRDDVELIDTIRNLLYVEMFTIAGARRQLERAELLDLDLTTQEIERPMAAHELAEAEERIEELESELRNADETSAALEERAAWLQQELESLESELARLNRLNDRLRSENEHLQERDAEPADVGRHLRALRDVRQELQLVATAARAVA